MESSILAAGSQTTDSSFFDLLTFVNEGYIHIELAPTDSMTTLISGNLGNNPQNRSDDWN